MNTHVQVIIVLSPNLLAVERKGLDVTATTIYFMLYFTKGIWMKLGILKSVFLPMKKGKLCNSFHNFKEELLKILNSQEQLQRWIDRK